MHGDDPLPWTLLQDGVVVGVERAGVEARITVEQPRLRAKFGGSGRAFVVALAGCTELAWVPADEPPIDDPAAIAASEPQILDARVEPGIGTVAPAIAVICAGGVLRLRYAALQLALDSGAAVSLADLRARSSVVALGQSEQ